MCSKLQPKHQIQIFNPLAFTKIPRLLIYKSLLGNVFQVKVAAMGEQANWKNKGGFIISSLIQKEPASMLCP